MVTKNKSSYALTKVYLVNHCISILFLNKKLQLGPSQCSLCLSPRVFWITPSSICRWVLKSSPHFYIAFNRKALITLTRNIHLVECGGLNSSKEGLLPSLTMILPGSTYYPIFPEYRTTSGYSYSATSMFLRMVGALYWKVLLCLLYK